MKTRILASFILLAISWASQAQTVRASLGPGTLPNSVKIYIRPDITLASVNISTLQFNLGVLSSVTPAPTAFISSTTASFPAAGSWTVAAAVEGGYRNFSIYTTVSPITISTTANTEIEVMEVTFTGGPLTATDVSLVCLPDGGTGATNGAALFYCTSVGLNSNGSSLYYARTGGVIVNNQFSYDASGATSGTTTSTATLSSVSLPTKFSSFIALKNNDDASLTWTVDNEENNAYFDVQRSVDGRLFTDVIRVNALKNGRTTNTYNTPDLNLSRLGSRTLYYRIKQVEATGEITYSEVRQLNLDKKNLTIGLYPNPVVTIARLVIDAPASGKAAIIVRDASGKTVQQFQLDLVKGVNQKEINAAALPAGDYIISVISDKIDQTVKMTKGN